MKDRTLNNEYEFEAIGAGWSIETKEPFTDAVKSRLHSRIDLFDETYSRFRTDSLVASIAAAIYGGMYTFPSNSLPLFELYDVLHKLTDGKVDPLIGAELFLFSSYSKGDIRGVESRFSSENLPEYLALVALLKKWGREKEATPGQI